MRQFPLFPEIFVRDRQAVCSSLDVAAHFNKKHLHVLRDIKQLKNYFNESKIGFVEKNFHPVTYTDPKGEARPAYNLTRDGFTLLAMGFTGAEALRWKIAYLEEFNRMEVRLAEAARREAEREAKLEAARRLAGPERAGLADQAMMLLSEGVTQAGAARLLRVSRHVIYRLRRRFGFLADATA